MRAGIHPNKEICCSKKYIANSIEAQNIDVENFFFQDFPKKKKSVGSAVKNRVGRVTLNKAIFFFCLMYLRLGIKSASRQFNRIFFSAKCNAV